MYTEKEQELIRRGRETDTWRFETYKGDQLGAAVLAQKGLPNVVNSFKAAKIAGLMQDPVANSISLYNMVHPRGGFVSNKTWPKGDERWLYDPYAEINIRVAEVCKSLADQLGDRIVFGKFAKTYASHDHPEYQVRFDALIDDNHLILIGDLDEAYMRRRANFTLEVTGLPRLSVLDLDGKKRFSLNGIEAPTFPVLADFESRRDAGEFDHAEINVDAHLQKDDEMKLFEMAAIVRGVSQEQIAAEYRSHHNPRKLFVFGDGDRLPQIMALDVETSGSYSTAHIIDLGVLYISSGTVVDTAESLLSMPKDYVQADGSILFEDLHHISWDMIKNRPTFATVAGNARSPFRQRLLSGEWVLMAHNAQFEIDRLSESMPGFRDFYRSGRLKVIDTMYMSRFLDKNGNKLTAPDWYRNDKLDSYAHRWGVLAEDEDELHRGFDDARIMWEAFERQLAAIQNGYY